MKIKFQSPIQIVRSESILKHEMTVKGHKIYTFKSLDVTPKIREMMLRIAYHQMGLGIRSEDLQTFCDISLERFNEGDSANVGSLLTRLKDYIKSYASEKLIYQLAGSIILVDKEPIDEPSEKYNQIKQELLKDKKVQAFFLNTALRLLEELGAKLDSSQIKEYMMSPERVIREETFLSLIKSGVTKGLWKYP